MEKRRYLVLVQGTHGWGDRWWRNGLLSAFNQRGFMGINPDEPFVWDTKLDGLIGANNGWEAAGLALKWYVRANQGVWKQPLVVVCHSHGGNVAAYAAQHGLWIDHLVTMMMPVRGDMEVVYAEARLNVGRWTHIHGGREDWLQIAGEFMDGRFGAYRQVGVADENIKIRGAGHDTLLEPDAWSDNNLWERVFHDNAGE